jgi:homoserine kinase type II
MNDAGIIPEIIERLHGLYHEIKHVYSFSEVKKGVLSKNFILECDNGIFFLKRHRSLDIKRIKEIQQVEFFLNTGGIPVILPIPTRDGNYFFSYADKFYSLLPFISGRLLHQNFRTKKSIQSAGSMLGHIHLLSRNGHPDIIQKRTSVREKTEFLLEAQLIEKNILSIEKRTNFDALALETLRFKVHLLSVIDFDYSDLRLDADHIIHGDYHLGNIFYDAASRVDSVFDLEKTEASPRVLELIRSMDLICFANAYTTDNFEYALAYLAAYNAIYPITSDELRRGLRAYYLKKARSLWVEREHYMYNNSRTDIFLNGELLMLQYYSKNLSTLIQRLTASR